MNNIPKIDINLDINNLDENFDRNTTQRNENLKLLPEKNNEIDELENIRQALKNNHAVKIQPSSLRSNVDVDFDADFGRRASSLKVFENKNHDYAKISLPKIQNNIEKNTETEKLEKSSFEKTDFQNNLKKKIVNQKTNKSSIRNIRNGFIIAGFCSASAFGLYKGYDNLFLEKSEITALKPQNNINKTDLTNLKFVGNTQNEVLSPNLATSSENLTILKDLPSTKNQISVPEIQPKNLVNLDNYDKVEKKDILTSNLSSTLFSNDTETISKLKVVSGPMSVRIAQISCKSIDKLAKKDLSPFIIAVGIWKNSEGFSNTVKEPTAWIGRQNGMVLMDSENQPNLSNLDSEVQILAYANPRQQVRSPIDPEAKAWIALGKKDIVGADVNACTLRILSGETK